MQDKAYAYAQAIEEYTQEGGGPKRLSVTTTFADDLVSQTRYDDTGTPTTRYVQADGFGSTRLLTDEQGNVTDAIDYDAFGNVIARVGATEIEHLYRGETLDKKTGLYYLRARWMDPQDGRFTQMDEWRGKSCTPVTLNKYIYANSDPVNGRDPSGHMTMGELTTAENGNVILQTTGRNTLRRAFSHFGCELGISIADEAITYGIYVLFDGTNFYVGQSNDIDRRQKEHLEEAIKDVTKAWKGRMQVVARFTTDGGKDAMRVMEQYVMDVLRLDGNKLNNTIEAINKKRGRLRHQYREFMKKVCK